MRDIGKNIKALRIEQKLTQDELAAALFVTRQTVSNYETGRSRPDVEMLLQIAEVLHTDVNAVLYGPQKPQRDRSKLWRLGIGGGITLVLAVPLILLMVWEDELRRSFWASPVYLVMFLFEPLLFLCLGWTLLQAMGVVTRMRPLQHKAVRYMRWGLLAFVLGYSILMAPFLLELVWYDIHHMLSWFDIQLYEGTFSFPLPQFWRFLFLEVLFLGNSDFMKLFGHMIPLFVGSGLWLCGFPQSKKKKVEKPAKNEPSISKKQETSNPQETGGEEI